MKQNLASKLTPCWLVWSPHSHVFQHVWVQHDLWYSYSLLVVFCFLIKGWDP